MVLTLVGALLLASVAGPRAEVSQPMPLKVGDEPAGLALLKPGVHRYLRYTIKDGRRSAIDIWTRTVAVEQQDGVTRLHLTQRWDRDTAPASIVTQDSWFDRTNFTPITHVRTVVKDGSTTISGYRFLRDRVEGMSELLNNSKIAFSVAAPEGAFNFEYDMELLQTLPWRRGYSADIVFHDPGGVAPAHYAFRYAGETTLRSADGKPVECWLVTADYNTGKVVQTFWIAKASQLVLHEEAEQNGTRYVKTLLAAEAADA